MALGGRQRRGSPSNDHFMTVRESQWYHQLLEDQINEPCGISISSYLPPADFPQPPAATNIPTKPTETSSVPSLASTVPETSPIPPPPPCEVPVRGPLRHFTNLSPLLDPDQLPPSIEMPSIFIGHRSITRERPQTSHQVRPSLGTSPVRHSLYSPAGGTAQWKKKHRPHQEAIPKALSGLYLDKSVRAQGRDPDWEEAERRWSGREKHWQMAQCEWTADIPMQRKKRIAAHLLVGI